MERFILLCSVLAVLSMSAAASAAGTTERAVFAGGCFWCMTPPFEKLDGVTQVLAGYTGGTGADPTYGDYAEKGHVEAVQVTFDPSRIGYEKLLDVFWRQIDPTDPGGEFCDRGPQYRTAIFYENEEQKEEAERSKEAMEKSGRFSKPIVTEIRPAATFYPAEEYHQDYYRKHPIKYRYYRFTCGRDQYLKKVWHGEAAADDPPAMDWSHYKKPSREELKKELTPLQFKVTQENGTEVPYHNEYWDNTRPGIYVDIVSGEPVFSSLDKYDAGTGWPSFTRPLVRGNVVEKKHWRWFKTSIDVRSAHADSHLGDLFHDGPPPAHLRYCLDSAALRFIPAEDLEKEGYGEFAKLFEPSTRP
jgi:peptide methionine sulfoxide reductase msrA/msrB